MGDDDGLESFFVNPIILLPKADFVILVNDTRYLYPITDLTNYSWPLEPVQMMMTRINSKNFTAISCISCIYHQVLLSPQTEKLSSFAKRGRQYTYQVVFYGFHGLPQWFSRMLAINFEPLIKTKPITYLDDSLLHSQTKGESLTIIHEYHQLLRKKGLKAAPEKTQFSWRKVKFLGLVFSEKRIQLVAKTVKVTEFQISPDLKRCFESPGMLWFLQLLP